MSNGRARVSTSNRWLGTTWKMSPALMYSWQCRTTASYWPRVKLDRTSSDDRRVRVDVAHAQVGTARGEAGDQLVDAIAGRLVGSLGVRGRADVGLRHDQDRLADVVEEDHPIVEGEREIGQPPVVVGDVGQVLGVSHGVVGRIADGPAGEPGEPREGERPGIVRRAAGGRVPGRSR